MCRERRLVAAMNFQLRFSPNVLALRDLLARGLLGEIVDIEVRLQVRQPWETWAFMRGRRGSRCSTTRSTTSTRSACSIGEPRGVYCRAVGHPTLPELRRSAQLDHPRLRRSHPLLADAQSHARVRSEAPRPRCSRSRARRRGAADDGREPRLPDGLPDTSGDRARRRVGSVALRGSWFTEAFEGPMSNLQRFVAGEDAALVSPVDDAIGRWRSSRPATSRAPQAARRFPSRPIVDAHPALLALRPREYAWIDDSMAALRRDFLPGDLEPHMEQAGVDACDRRPGAADHRRDRVAAGARRCASVHRRRRRLGRSAGRRRRGAAGAGSPRSEARRRAPHRPERARRSVPARAGVRPRHRGAREAMASPTTS